jgi:hypothetical protein
VWFISQVISARCGGGMSHCEVSCLLLRFSDVLTTVVILVFHVL